MSVSDYHSAFNNILRTKEREEFKLLLCDVETCDEKQKDLLKPLLFEKDGHQVAENWGNYLAYTITSFPDRNVHLQRLVNKALEFLDETQNRDNKFYLGVHLRSAQLKADQESSQKYIETIIVKKKIGLKCSVLYLEWAKVILRKGVTLNVETIRKARDALKRGLKAFATPQEFLEKGLKFLDGYDDVTKHEDMAYNLREIIAIRPDGSIVSTNKEAREILKVHPSANKQHTETSVIDKSAIVATPATKNYDGADDETHDIQRSVSSTSKKRGLGTVEKSLGGPGGRMGRLGGLGGLAKMGRCQRVVKKEDEDDDVDSSRDVSFEQSRVEDDTTAAGEGSTETVQVTKANATTTGTVEISGTINMSKDSSNTSGSGGSAGSKRKSTSSSEGEETTGTNKLDLSKYIDDKLLSFDPQGARSAKKRSKNNRSDALNNSTLSTTGTMAISSAMKVPQSASKRTSIESKKSGTGVGDKRSSLETTVEADKENMVPRNNNKGYGSGSEAPAAKVSKTSQERVRFAPASSSSPGGSERGGNHDSYSSRQLQDNKSNPLVAFNDSFKVITMNGQQYLRFGTLGKGGSSCVYSILSQDSQVYAFKKVFVSANSADPEALFESYVNEIDLLNSLKGSPYIIQLVDSQVDKESLSVSMIMEAGEIDLSKVLKKRNQIHGISPFFTRMIWTEMLESVDYIHENRIVHGDLKPANFVFVKGHLKLIDFGIAKAFNNDTTNIYRDSQIGTINYMAPEAIVAPKAEEMSNSSKGAKLRLGRASDVWSLGCILYQLVYGSPPFAALNTIQKLHAIPNPNYDISYPTKIRVGPVLKEGEEGDPEHLWYIHSHTIDSMKACLFRDPAMRSPIRGENGLLGKPFLTIGDSDKNVL